MLQNRSMDHMLGWLYADSGNISPAGQPSQVGAERASPEAIAELTSLLAPGDTRR